MTSSPNLLLTISDLSDCIMNHLKIKVDRPTLETMLLNKHSAVITGDDDDVDSSSSQLSVAQKFFVKVSEESEAIISYPQLERLRSMPRKEPEVLVFGSVNQIYLAKELIMRTLDPHRNKVTLKIDVAHTDHSHLIGKGGKRIQQIMDSTGCHIHFPDGNRNVGEEKSNQVTIAGLSFEQTELARAQIRQNLPLIISFNVELTNVGLLDMTNPTMKYIQSRYSVIVWYKMSDNRSAAAAATKTSDKMVVTIFIRGTRQLFNQLREAALNVYQYLNWTPIGFNNTVVTISIDIAAQHHAFTVGRNSSNIRSISDMTGAIIIFPQYDTLGTPSKVAVPKTTVLIKGRGLDSAFTAWLQLLSYLPVFLIFELSEYQQVDGSLVTELAANQMISVMIRPKTRTNGKTIVIKAHERNVHLLYEARNELMKSKIVSPVRVAANVKGQTVASNGLFPVTTTPPISQSYINNCGLTSGSKLSNLFTKFHLPHDLDIEVMRAVTKTKDSKQSSDELIDFDFLIN
ncbi:protein bicaudal C homolog 1-like [Oppia nitens]|uniref:protein bicaudal C homolog 1-like n=1 Tax=Oppia nitens TaxID=1686743 RepID=UPI0023DBA26E|nr:protein bicaudal C homolog 1-like [Oppia nitens]